MHSMVGPPQAKQVQTHKIQVERENFVRKMIVTQTFEFPYSDAFNVNSM